MKAKIFCSIAFIIVFFGLVFLLQETDLLGSNATLFNQLNKYFNTNPNVEDFFDEIGFDNTVEDIKLFCDDSQTKFKLQIGDVSFKFKDKDLVNEKNIEALETIGITMKRVKSTGKIVFFWRGNRITEYAD